MTSPPRSIPITKNGDDHRARLLNRLGIDRNQQKQPMTAAQNRRLRILRGMGVGYTLHPSPPDGSAVRPPLDGVQGFREPLKCRHEVSSDATAAASSAGTDTGTDTKQTLRFQDEVEVVPIPTRFEYSDRIKSRIWSSRHELQENAERNALEFAAEGWNWRTVTEDDGMFICSVSGELVHPIHLQHLVAQQQEEEEQQQQEQQPELPHGLGGLERGAPVH